MVRTLRCGRRNPGSNPGHGTYFLSFSSNQTSSCDTSRYLLIGNKQSRDRRVVRTLRCGRRNPGSNLGHGTYFLSFSSNQTSSCDISRYLLIESKQSRDRRVVRTLRCGRRNPGSNPGHGNYFFHFPRIRLLPVIYLDIYELKPRKPRSSSG